MPGVYLFLDKRGDVLYVGKARNLRIRVTSYFSNSKQLLPKTQKLVNHIKTIRAVPVESEIESLVLEASYIKKYKPHFNSRLTDGKAYPLIEVTGDELPKVVIARKESHPRSVYFGPFPNVHAVKTVIRAVRKIFPFQSVRNHQKRRCLYNHLGLCPCPPLFTSEEEKKQYRRSIAHLITFLGGNTRKVLVDLAKERTNYSSMLAFEEAQKVQACMNAIVYVTTPFHKPFEYDANPNLRIDLRRRELDSLQTELRKRGIAVAALKRVEAYDISNFQGKQAVGSMVVAIHGELDRNEYRRFRIRLKDTPNDIVMLFEVLQRRVNHTEWAFPDLVVVDGGKAQVSVAKNVIALAKLSIPVIGLAKRFEEIVIDKSIVRLARSSPALQLLQRLRDEAHRFALQYHRRIRTKATFS